jgi:putative transposase
VRPVEGDWRYPWIDGTYGKVPRSGRIVSVLVTMAAAVNTEGRREVLGMEVGVSEPSRSGLVSCARSRAVGCEA